MNCDSKSSLHFNETIKKCSFQFYLKKTNKTDVLLQKLWIYDHMTSVDFGHAYIIDVKYKSDFLTFWLRNCF